MRSLTTETRDLLVDKAIVEVLEDREMVAAREAVPVTPDLPEGREIAGAPAVKEIADHLEAKVIVATPAMSVVRRFPMVRLTSRLRRFSPLLLWNLPRRFSPLLSNRRLLRRSRLPVRSQRVLPRFPWAVASPRLPGRCPAM